MIGLKPDNARGRDTCGRMDCSTEEFRLLLKVPGVLEVVHRLGRVFGGGRVLEVYRPGEEETGE